MDILSLYLSLLKKYETSLKMSGQLIQALRDRRVKSSMKGHNIHRAGPKKPLGQTIRGMYAPRDKINRGCKILGLYNMSQTDQGRIIWGWNITAPHWWNH
jgi:hypothetical protein